MAVARAGAPDASPAEVRAVKAWLYWGLFWLALGPLLGLLQSTQFFLPTHLSFLEAIGLPYSKLRIIHTNTVIYGWLGGAFLAVLHYIVPRLLKTELHSPRLGVLSAWLWNLGLALNVALIWAGVPGNLLLSIQPYEYAEAPILSDILVASAVVVAIYNAHKTFLSRRSEGVYITVWYLIMALYMTALIAVVVNFINPFVFKGVGNQVIQAWWIHNAVGIFVTPLGVGVLYFVIPLASRTPLYSHRLSILGFWTLILFYPATGLHHFLQAPIPTWLNELAVTSSILLIIPVLAVTVNFLGTPGENWRRLWDSYPLRFALLSALYYLATCLQGPIQATNIVNWYIHFTEWTAAHAHLALTGAFTAAAMSGVLYVLPRVTGREYSRAWASFVFWVMAIGFPVFFFVFTGSGVTTALGINVLDQNITQMLPAQEPWRVTRSLAGIVLALAFLGFAHLCWQSVRKGAPVREEEQDASVLEAHAAGGGD